MRSNVFLDSCAFDPKYTPEDTASRSLYQLYEQGELILHIAHSTQKETDHPNTPAWVKQEANLFIFTNKVQLTDEEIKQKEKILNVLTGMETLLECEAMLNTYSRLQNTGLIL